MKEDIYLFNDRGKLYVDVDGSLKEYEVMEYVELRRLKMVPDIILDMIGLHIERKLAKSIFTIDLDKYR